MTIHLPGYSSEGHDTLGAGYAREHPEDMPDGFVAGETKHVGNHKVLRFTTGEFVKFYGMKLRVLAVGDYAVVLDLRGYTPEHAARYLDSEMLVFWRGFYWYVPQVRGVFVTLQLWGVRARRAGWRTWYRKGKLFTRQTGAVK